MLLATQGIVEIAFRD
ncbi:hypothetical protein YPPY01_2182, partial [Yersinia pestis PY-01]